MPEITARVEQEQQVFTWRAPSRPFKKKGQQFLTTPMVIAILVGIVLLFAGEWMLIGVVAAMIFAYYVWTTVPPEMTEYIITNKGVRLHGELYNWDVLSRWWIDEKWGQKMLVIETPANVVGRLAMPLGETKEEEVVKIMEKFLIKEKPPETTLDKMGGWMSQKFPLTDQKM